MHAEVERVVNVERVDYRAWIATIRARYNRLIRPGAMLHGQPFEWFDDQIAALLAVEHAGGGLLMVEVGGGKTYITFAIGAGHFDGHEPFLPESRPLLLVPASDVKSTFKKWRAAAEVLYIRPLTVWSYESLSAASGASRLETFRPTLILADEAHYLRYITSARTKRVLRFLAKYPHARLVCLSGTLTGKSLKHYSHLSQAALGAVSPLPRTHSVLDAWARVIDPEQTPKADDMAFIAPLRNAFAPGEYGVPGAMKAYANRLGSCPGVVISAGDGPKCSLKIKRWQSLRAPQEVRDAMREAEAAGRRPDGEMLARPVDQWRCLRELLSGYYNVWDWSHTTDGRPDLEWMDARSRWGEVERRYTKTLQLHAKDPLDSAGQVWSRFRQKLDVQSGQTFSAEDEAFLAWQEQKKKTDPPTVAQWISTYLVDLADELRTRVRDRRMKPCLIWVSSVPLQRALADRHFDVRGQGTQSPDTAADRAKGVVVCSINVHGKSANLQFQWSRNVVLESPPNAVKWEQLLGRTHRSMQPEDVVEFLVLEHASNLQRQWERVLDQARYVKSTERRRQRLLYADTEII